MARKKLEEDTGKTRTMLIRDVPEDIWTEVDRYCRDQSVTRRDFLAMALESLRGAEGQDEANLATQRAKEALDTIEKRLKVLVRAETLRMEIWGKGGGPGFAADESLQERTQAEFNRLQSELVKQMELLLPPADEAVGEGRPLSSGPQILERQEEERRKELEEFFNPPVDPELEKS